MREKLQATGPIVWSMWLIAAASVLLLLAVYQQADVEEQLQLERALRLTAESERRAAAGRLDGALDTITRLKAARSSEQ